MKSAKFQTPAMATNH